MTSRGRVCTLQLREMRVSGKRFPSRLARSRLAQSASHRATGSQMHFGLGRLTEMNRPWDLSDVRGTNVGNKQLGEALLLLMPP